MESVLRSEAYSSDGSMKENQSENAHSSPPERLNGNRSSSEEQTPVKGEKEETENLLYGGGHCRSAITRQGVGRGGHCKNSLGADCRREEKLIVDRYIGRNSVSIQVARLRERMLES